MKPGPPRTLDAADQQEAAMSGSQTTGPTEDEALDDALEDTFPASDPPSIGGSTGPSPDRLEEE